MFWHYFITEQYSMFAKNRIHRKLKNGEQIRVGFIGYPSAPSVDVFSNLYDVFSKDKRFKCVVLAFPYTHDDKDSMIEKYIKTLDYLEERKINVIKGYDKDTDTYVNYKDEFDIAFFEIEYDWVRPEFKTHNFRKALTYFIPYGPYVADNIAYHFAAKMMSEVHCIFTAARNEREMVKKYSEIRGLNVCKEYLGYPKNDIFFNKNITPNDVWKKAKPTQKRIIWAPHHTWAAYSNFHTYAKFFLDYAQKHDDVFIAFKPHPSLHDSLKNIDRWSRERINDYYAQWINGDNTALFDGAWFDLFMTSDAMIMDSISFMQEYALTKKPSCVLIRENRDGEREMKFSECGEDLYTYLYHAKNTKEVEMFIENIHREEDPMFEERNRFVERNYQPPFGRTGSENIYEYVKKEVGLI